MLELNKIAITGTLSSGKTTVCRILEELGAYQLNSDLIVHELLSSDKICIQKITELLGSDVLTNGKLDRQKIANIVFQKPQKLQKLEEILHPKVLEIIKQTYREVKESKRHRLFVVEVPLLFEMGWEKYFDATILIKADLSACKKRYSEKSGDFDKRKLRLLSDEVKEKKADFVLQNNGSLEDLKAKITNLLNELS